MASDFVKSYYSLEEVQLSAVILAIFHCKETPFSQETKLTPSFCIPSTKAAGNKHEFLWNKPVKFIQIFTKCSRVKPIPVPRAYYSNMTKHAQQSNLIGCIHLLMPEEDACLLYVALLSQAAFQKMF